LKKELEEITEKEKKKINRTFVQQDNIHLVNTYFKNKPVEIKAV